ncbi:MAG: trypsin-like peptidase domain-containing protein [Syntrophaceae bacterium]|nr:trypsin-like peptidase domain-containing protein [Syntrophaceae bacterium]
MMTRWFLILWGFFFSVMISVPSTGEEISTLIKKVSPSFIAILTYDQEGRLLSEGKGFFISREGDVITNRHLLEGASRAEIKASDGMLYPVTRVVTEDKEADLIRLSVEIPPGTVHPLAISTVLLQLGERVMVIDTSKPEKPGKGGVISGLWEIPDFGKGIQISTSLSSVCAGNPVISMNGQVIGVIISRTIEGHPFHFILTSERIARFKPTKGKTLTEWGGRREEVAEALYAKGFPFLWKEEYKKALFYFEEAVKKNPRYAQAYFQIGYCHAQLGRYKKAVKAYEEAIHI